MRDEAVDHETDLLINYMLTGQYIREDEKHLCETLYELAHSKSWGL